VLSEFKEVKAAYEYYAFGMSLAKIDNGYRYGFNGYEKDPEIGQGQHVSFADYGYDPLTCRRWNVDPLTSTFVNLSPYSFAANNPIYNIDEDGESPKPNIKRIILWFTIKRLGEQNRAEMINETAAKYKVSSTQIALILFRENQTIMSNDKTRYLAIRAKEDLFAAQKAKWFSGGIDGDADRWSIGVTQLQIKHVIRLTQDMTVEQYDAWKNELLKTDKGKKEYLDKFKKAVTILENEKESIDVLGKYVKELNDKYPNSTDEQISKDFMRGPHINRDPKAPKSAQANEDWENANSVKDIIVVILKAVKAKSYEKDKVKK
jgi:RHS repeat-associated protein